MIVLIGVVLLSIFFFVLMFFCAKTWKIMHIFATFLVYSAAIAFCVFATISLKTNAAWKEKVKTMRAELEAQQKIKEELEVGKLYTLATTKGSQMDLPQELWRQTYDRGVILSGCTPGNFDGTSVTVTTVPAADPSAIAPADGSAPPPPPPNGLSQQMIVHVFKESDTADGKIPAVYIGEFEVQAPTDTSATLRTTLKLDPIQDRLAKTRDGSTWALYGQMPRDTHFAFTDPDASNPVATAKEAVRVAEQELGEAKRAEALGKENVNVAAANSKLQAAKDALAKLRARTMPLFGQPLSSEQLTAMLPNVQQLKQMLPRAAYPADPLMSDAEYDQHIQDVHKRLVERYAFDGRPVADVAAAAPDFKVAGNTYQKIKFKLADGAPYEVEVDAAGEPLPADEDPLSTELFDSVNGLAKPQHLRQGAPTRFSNVYDIDKRFADEKLGSSALGDIGIFDQATADSLTGSGVIAEKLDDQFYVRPLRDYEYLFHEYERRDTLLSREASEIAAATASVTESKGKVDAQIKIRSDQQAKLAADASSFTTDLDTITAERKQLESTRQVQLNNLRGLYQGINERVAQLTQLQRDLAAEAQKRAAMVSTGGE